MKPGRLQPPVGYRVPLSDLIRAMRGLTTAGSRDRFEREVAGHFGVEHACAVSSGKAALTTALRALHGLTGRTRVIFPAYTCYSVPSAIVKAGLIPVPVDVRRGSFDYDYDRLQNSLDDTVLCALSVHLFGIPADTHRLIDSCRRRGIFVIEDAAQAMGVTSGGQPLGTRADVGFFSLGRGKNITGGSGGVILASDPDIVRALRALRAGMQTAPAVRRLRTIIELAVMSVFISPYLYWVPAGIPWLRLGETIFHSDFRLELMADVQAEALHQWRRRLTLLNAARRRAAAFYRRHIPAAAGQDSDIPYLRFPVLVRDPAERDRILREGRASGIGVMYPRSVGAIPELRSRLTSREFPEAERIAAALITLPTHPLLTDRDRARVCAVVNGSAMEPLDAVHDRRAAAS